MSQDVLGRRFWLAPAVRPLGSNDYVLSADEKTGLQARHRDQRSSSTSMSQREPGSASPPWMSPVPKCSAAVSSRMASSPSSSPLALDHTCPHADPASWLDQIEDLLLHRSTQRNGHSRPMTSILWQGLRRLLSPSKISYEKSAAPFRWKFTREDLAKLMIRLNARAVAPVA